MPEEPKHKIGPWTLHDILGYGGNSTVWRATRANYDSPIALKVINETKVDEESYLRFVREVQFLVEHGSGPGVLPYLAHDLPARPSKRDRAWLAMPIAVPIATALEGRPLTDVVDAVAEIAGTLLRLQRDFNIAHRDIKPGNLYELNGEFLIGDFGLIAISDAESLTSDGRQVGPAHFTAHEMILNPSNADPHPADVYSLGKTLWVLATGQRFPPEGHQPVGTRRFEIGDFRPHPRSQVLDQEVDLMTRLRPEERPSKEQVARDLTTWKELATEIPVMDVSEARVRFRAKIEKALDEQDTQEEYKELAHAAARHLQELTAPLNSELKNLYPRAQVYSMTDAMTKNILKGNHFGRTVIWDWRRCTILSPFDRPMGTTLRMARALELFDDGTLHLYLVVDVGPERTMGNYFHWTLKQPASAPVGSVEAERMLDDGVRELANAVKQGVEVFVDRLPDLGGTS